MPASSTVPQDGTRVAFIPRSVVMPWIEVGALEVLGADIERPLRPVGDHRPPKCAGSATRLPVDYLWNLGRDPARKEAS